jgi:hypothetical protein
MYLRLFCYLRTLVSGGAASAVPLVSLATLAMVGSPELPIIEMR